MYKGRRIIVLVPAFNEEIKIAEVARRIDYDIVDTLLVINDASTDGTVAAAKANGATVVSHQVRSGVGAALRTGIEYARETGHDIALFMAGNNKDNPNEIPRLLDPICDEDYDIVMGSRYLPGGAYGGDMPAYRKLATRVHPLLMSMLTRRRLTESTNGFRAFKLSALDDPRIRIDQPWLDTYGMEVYMLFKLIKLGYRHTEVPCTKIYPAKSQGYTKMKPVVGWWEILRPVFYLGLGLRR